MRRDRQVDWARLKLVLSYIHWQAGWVKVVVSVSMVEFDEFLILVESDTSDRREDTM